MTTPSFSDLLDRARAGRPAAIDHVLRCVEDRLRHCVDARLGPGLRVRMGDSDVLQNAYVEMLRSLPRFVGATEDDFVAWVATIIENDIRRQRRWFNAGKRAAPERTSERNALARVLLEDPPTPSTEAVADEERELLARAMAQLPEDYAEVIELAIHRGLPHSEIAERMGRSASATRMLLSRARAALGQAIERLDPGA
ncbi:MAG: sigma-70 family RNA polymerase sigma factor [Planctomycetota bacterium]